MATESWVLGGVILTSGTFTLMELNADPPRARPDWISAADSEAAALFRQPLHENRTITMKLRVTPQASMNTALDKVGLLVDQLRLASATPAGISLVWTPNGSTRSCTFNVLAGEITGLPIALSGDGYSWLLSSPIVSVQLTCHPYWLGTETLTSTASTSTPFVTMEITGVTGDIPALGRIIITDTATQSRRHVEWGIEGPLTYNASTSLLVDSDDMVVSGFAGSQITGAGAYDPNATGNNCIQAMLFTGQTIAVCGTGNLSHVGTFRVKARIQTSLLQNQVRLSWRAGDGPPTTNAWDNPVSNTGWVEADLGTISVPAVVVGTQRWTAQVEAYSAAASPGVVIVDYLILIPVADGYGRARASYIYTPGVLAGVDSFVGTTSGSALATRTAPLGGSWATSGDTTDLAFTDIFPPASEGLIRSTTAVETVGRYAILGSSSYTDVQVDARLYTQSNSAAEQAIVARWTDASNHLRFVIPDGDDPTRTVKIQQVVAGVATTLVESAWSNASGFLLTVRLLVYASGQIIGQIRGGPGEIVGVTLMAELKASATTAATGGTLQTGKIGLRDLNYATPNSAARYYTDFAVRTPPTEPIVLYSGKNMQVRYDDTLRQDSTGTYTGKPASYRGSRFLVPVGTSRVIVKARRSDIEAALDDQVTDATQIQIGWTPRGLAVPR